MMTGPGLSLSISRLEYSGMSRTPGYDIEVVDTFGLTRVMSQVKLPTPNPLGSTTIDLINGPTADLLRLAMNNFPPFIAMEPLLSFLKDMFCDAGLGSSAAKSDLIDGDHEEEPICDKCGNP